jgi:hypothetical protein
MQKHRSARTARHLPALAILALAAALGAASPARAASDCAPQEIAGPSIGAPLSALARARRDCPLLGAILEEYAAIDLGEAFPDRAEAAASPEFGAAARFAASGDVAAMALHARPARDAGAPPAPVRELVYLVAVSAGIPKAMEAIRVLAEDLAAAPGSRSLGREACLHQSGKTSLLQN